MRFSAHGFLISDRINRMDKMNGASGASDIEGEAATGSGERGGSRASFNSENSNGEDSVDSVHSVEKPLPNSRKVHVSGKLHHDIRVPLREISLAPTKSMNGEIELNEPVRVYDTSGPWGDPDFHGDVTQGLPPLRAKWIRDRGDVEEYEGRVVRPIDDGYLSEKHAASGNGKNGLVGRDLSSPAAVGARRKPFRASAGHPVTQLWYARQGIITPEMEFIAIRENLGRTVGAGADRGASANGSGYNGIEPTIRFRNDLDQQHPGESFGANIPREITSEFV